MLKSAGVKVSQQFHRELVQALDEVGGWGSVEIFIQGHKVTQITRRKIKKTNHDLNSRQS